MEGPCRANFFAEMLWGGACRANFVADEPERAR